MPGRPRRRGRVSIDLNYRKKLWNYGVKAPEVMRPLVALADVLIANEEDIQLGLGIAAEADPSANRMALEAYKALAARPRPSSPTWAWWPSPSGKACRRTQRLVCGAGRQGRLPPLPKYALENIVDPGGGRRLLRRRADLRPAGVRRRGPRPWISPWAASALKHSIPAT